MINKISFLNNISKDIRKDIVNMLFKGGSGHPGGSLSSTDILVNLYFSGLVNINKKNYKNSNRDIIILSAGHYCPALYAVLAKKKFFNKKLLSTFRKINSPLLGHPKYLELPGVENSGGSLGQGISLACGYALASKRFNKNTSKVYCVMGDGEQNEGQVWEAAMFASHYELSNLCIIVDSNKIQIDGFTKDIMNVEPLLEKYKSFNFLTKKINGHNHVEILNAIRKFRIYNGKKPTLIIANTIAGKGLKSIEGKVEAHGKPLEKKHLSEIAL